jgi:hypothetical protein
VNLHLLCLCERTLNVRGFPLREEGQVAWLESPNGLGASSSASLFRMQARGFLLQQIHDREQIETVEHSPARGEDMPTASIFHYPPTNLPLTDAALLNVDRLGRRLVEFRLRKDAVRGGAS